MTLNDVRERLESLKRPTDIKTLAASLGAETDEVEAALKRLESEGRAVLSKGKRYAPLRIMQLTLCRASAAGNACFARPVDGGQDMYLDMPDEIAFDGDTILVRQTEYGDRPRGFLVSIVKRAHSLITGGVYVFERPYHVRGRSRKAERRSRERIVEAFAIISDRRLPSRIPIDGDLLGARAGDLCLFEVIKWPRKGGTMRVCMSKVLGRSNDMTAQLEALLATHGIAVDFSDAALKCADSLPNEPSADDMAGRRDLRDKCIFTIDGSDAKDFDDAVSLEYGDSGECVLGVHIADVSHYVREGEPIDSDARARGTSVYLPGLTVPMLPEALSNNLCSLRPNENRLAYSLIMTLSGTNVVSYELFPSVIRSCARLTYEGVNARLAGESADVPDELLPTLESMNALAKRLKKARIARGALELDIPEPMFELDANGIPETVCARDRGDAHMLIEEFMLLANETVAAHANKFELPFPYRVHEAPDVEKLMSLEELITSLGKPRKLGTKPVPKKLQAVLSDFDGMPEASIVARTLLRCMSRARYSDKPLGHYGLAKSDYCHFTSPIRRYPDLIAHRMLKALYEGDMNERTRVKYASVMPDITSESSAREYAASVCERDADGMMCAAYFSRHIGERLTATVTHLSRRGAFVALDNTAEGRIPPPLMDDFYQSDDERMMMIGERSRRVVRLGDRIEIEVYSANVESGEIEFCMV